MDCLKTRSPMRNLEWKYYHTIPNKVPSDRIWMTPRSLPFPRASTNYPECDKPVIVTIKQLLRRHSSLRTFAALGSLNEDSSSLSLGGHLSNTIELAPKDASEGFLTRESNEGDHLSNANELAPKDASEGFLTRQSNEGDHLSNTIELAPKDASEGFLTRQSNEGDHLSNTNELAPKDASEGFLTRQSNELKSRLADSERIKLLKKLSEANQYNRHLKRQLKMTDDALVNYKSELAVLELELQSLVSLAEEVANSSIQLEYRKINGKYISSHLRSRLEAVHGRIKEQIKDMETQKVEEIALFWAGLAESVQVMGSFDGWSQGEEMSPEHTGSYTRFSTKLKLRPGRYEIKFVVDGEWQLSPEFPIVGEGLLTNNLLVVQ